MPDPSGHLHLVIPAYHEAERICPLLEELAELAEGLNPISVRVVEDSGDGPEREATLKAIAPIVESSPIFLEPLCDPKNLGKGGAVRSGWNNSPPDATWLGFLDADGSVSGAEVLRAMKEIRSRESRDIVFFASRVLMLGRNVDRELHRHLIGRAFATLGSMSLRIKCYDSQCGFKVLPKAAFEKIEPALEVDGFAFDLELLAFLVDEGIEIEEFPVDWHEVGGSSVSLIKDPMRMYLALRDIARRRSA